MVAMVASSLLGGRSLGYIGNHLRRNFGLVLDPQRVKILMKPHLKFDRLDPFAITRKEFERLGNRVHGWSQKALDIGAKDLNCYCWKGHTETNKIVCEEVVDENSIKNQHADLIEPEISLHELTGWSIPRTMRIKARICHHELEVLIDSGSTHNFLSAKMAQILQLSIIPTKPFVI
ncbi:hypothetical protein Pint_12959 [Pistacia integerrima]|uniref:Uncharacterized protein n=1 Tax=Pistacia integerrima TaxID=434235 RepID=A0ACC0Y9A6_9ROSI|nr:hypothetical protein Pint_12959 [Pistacia integerrima]